MRFSIDLEFSSNPPYEIPKSYRNNIESLIKEAVKQSNSELFSQFWADKNGNIPKPFTFSSYIPSSTVIQKRNKDTLLLNTSPIKLHISSSDAVFLNKLYNALENLENYSPFEYPIKLRLVSPGSQRSFTDDPTAFDTLSPIIVKKISKRSNAYLFFDDPGFEDALLNEIKGMYRRFIDEDYNPGKKDLIVTFLSARKIYVNYGKQSIKATIGTIKVYAPKEVQELIYDAGMGALRDQGFGMLELAGAQDERRN